MSEILNLLSGFTALEQKADNLYIGNCPFCKTNFLYATPATEEYHCFNCGMKGDVTTLTGAYANKTVAFQNKKLYSLFNDVGKMYYLAMKNTRNNAYSYFKNVRHISDHIINKFGLGYSSDKGLEKKLKELGYSNEDIMESGLIKEGQYGNYDFFRNRAMIPIINEDGNIIGFGARALGDFKPKYLNSPDSSIFNKSAVLFALNFAQASARTGLILCEGYMDVITMHQYGFDNTIASLGTAFTDTQARIIAKHTDTVYLAYDSDNAGHEATLKNLRTLRKVGINGKVVDLSPYKDPDEFLQGCGPAAMEKRILSAKDGICYELEHIKNMIEEASAKDCISYEQNLIKNKVRKELTRFLYPLCKNMNDIEKYVTYVNDMVI